MFFVWTSCMQPMYTYQFTEKNCPFDTTIIIKNIQQYPYLYLNTFWEFNDTVIFYGRKLAPQRFELAREVESSFRDDTIRISFDKYKATKVRVYEKVKFLRPIF